MRTSIGRATGIALALAALVGAPRVVVAGEPVLEGEAKKTHDAEVKRIVAELRTEKNKVNVKAQIDRIGSSKRRAERDALIEFASGLKNQEWLGYCFTALSQIGGAKVIEFLTGKSALRSPDFLTAQQAAGALATTKDPSAAGALLDVIVNPATKSEVLGAAAKAVAQIAPKDARVAETLMAFSKAVKDMTRAYCAEALGYLATDDAVTRLVEMLAMEKNAGVREGAARGLGNTGRADVIPNLEQVLRDDRSLQVRDAASTAITRLQSGR